MTEMQLIKILRRHYNLSQFDLAKILGQKTAQSVSGIERGIWALPPKALPILKATYGSNWANAFIKIKVREYKAYLTNKLNTEKKI